MGQKVNPIGLRLGINRNWSSRWYPNWQRVPAFIAEDDKIRKFLKKELYYAGIADIIIERTAKRLRVTIVAARPGIIIGKKGSDIEKLKNMLEENDIIVVSLKAAELCKYLYDSNVLSREDIVKVYFVGNSVRDENGRIIGADALSSALYL